MSNDLKTDQKCKRDGKVNRMAKFESSGIEVSKRSWGKWVFEFFLKDLCGELLLNCEGRKGSLLRRSQEKLLPTKSFGMKMQGTL